MSTPSTTPKAATQLQTESARTLTNPHERWRDSYHYYALVPAVLVSLSLSLFDDTRPLAGLVAIVGFIFWAGREVYTSAVKARLMQADHDTTGRMHLPGIRPSLLTHSDWMSMLGFLRADILSYALLWLATTTLPVEAFIHLPELRLPSELAWLSRLIPFLHILLFALWTVILFNLPYFIGEMVFEDSRFEQARTGKKYLSVAEAKARKQCRIDDYLAHKTVAETWRAEVNRRISKAQYNILGDLNRRYGYSSSLERNAATRKLHAEICEEIARPYKGSLFWEGDLCVGCKDFTESVIEARERPCRWSRTADISMDIITGPVDGDDFYLVDRATPIPWVVPTAILAVLPVSAQPPATLSSTSATTLPATSALPAIPEAPMAIITPLESESSVLVQAMETTVTPKRPRKLSLTGIADISQLPRLRTSFDRPVPTRTPSLSEDSSSSPSSSSSLSSASTRTPERTRVRFADFDVFTVAGPPEMSTAMLPHSRRYRQ